MELWFDSKINHLSSLEIPVTILRAQSAAWCRCGLDERSNHRRGTTLRISTGTCLFVIVLFALIVRLVLVGYVVGVNHPPTGDEVDYHSLASNLADDAGYRLADGQITARRPPLYPFVLSLLYRIFGAKPAVARICQVVLGTMIVWLVFVVSKRLFTPWVAWVAAALTAVNPFLVFISGYLLTENLYIVILLLILLAVPKPTWEWRRILPAGLLLGLCSLARPTALGMALWIVAFALLLGDGSIGKRALRGFVILALVGLMMLPWGARNHAVFGKWLFSTTHGGVTFYQGNNEAVLTYPQYYGGVAPLYMLPGYESLEKMPELERDEEARAMGKRFLKEHKRSVPILAWRKFARFWRFRSDAGMSGVKSGWWFSKESTLGRLASSLDVGFAYAVFVIPLFVIGLFLSLRAWRRYVYLYGLVVIHTAVTLVFHGSIRMRVPLEPVIAIFAAYAIHFLVQRFRPASTTDSPRAS
jgi:4-amino-4-deoxy-L-arabinose transferase-like glycosyltransferase